jgi:class 3 adenylate cyclase
MAALSGRERSKLPDSAFAYIDSDGRRRLPIHDESHVRNALARFGRVNFEDEAARDRARTRLLKAARKHRIVPIGFIDTQLRPKLPTGSVTLFFADLVGSTRHLAELEERYGPMLTALRRVIRTTVRRHHGQEVDARADEYFAAFGSASDALAAAIESQRAIAATGWPDGRTVVMRLGLHTGRPTLTPTGYVGIAVNTAVRICELAGGGQVLVSTSTRTALMADPAHELRSIGAHRLRGIPDLLELFEAVADGLAASRPATQPDASRP